MKTAIIIPARYASTRFPGKPLHKIAGQTMLSRVVDIADAAAKAITGVDVFVATDDERIAAHCTEINAPCIMTDKSCATGTDRVQQAADRLDERYDLYINLQGDAPLTPPHVLQNLIKTFHTAPNEIDIITPVIQLTWEELDIFRERKKTTPFSGTCAILGPNNDAIWFSKQVIPAIRKEEKHRAASELSPVYRHPGLYGYHPNMLFSRDKLTDCTYETLEGLEQLRYLYNGYRIRCVPSHYGVWAAMSGIDSPTDAARCEALLREHGELLQDAA